MSCCEEINNLLNKIIEKDKAFNLKIQTHWEETEKVYKNNIPIGHVRKLYVLVVNDISVKNLLYQSIKKEIAKSKIKEAE